MAAILFRSSLYVVYGTFLVLVPRFLQKNGYKGYPFILNDSIKSD